MGVETTKGYGAILGVNVGRPIVSNGTFWHSCAKVREPIELSLWVASGVGPDISVLDGVHVPQGKGDVFGVFLHWFEWRSERLLEEFFPVGWVSQRKGQILGCGLAAQCNVQEVCSTAVCT